jgi:YD repeat-containing protein
LIDPFGKVEANYDLTEVGYDSLGRLIKVIDPSRTIDSVDYDLLDRPVAMYKGVEGKSPVKTGELVYDGEREKPQPGTKVAAKTAAKKSQPAAKPQPKQKLASAAR